MEIKGSWLKNGIWHNEPGNWSVDNDELRLTTDQGSDYWRETYYGFTRNSGHFFAFETPAAFTAQFRVRGHYHQLYDQAGIMLWLDEQHWVKAGIELSDGIPMAASVLTNGKSDWATAPFGHDATDFWIRATVEKGAIRIQISTDGRIWPLVRLGPFPAAERYLVGPMACTPERSGLQVCFSDFQLSAPLGKDLHDLS